MGKSPCWIVPNSNDISISRWSLGSDNPIRAFIFYIIRGCIMTVQFDLTDDENELFLDYQKKHYCSKEVISNLVKFNFVQYLRKNTNPKLHKSHYWKDIDVDYCAEYYPNLTNEHFDVLCYMTGWIGSKNAPSRKIICGKIYFWISIGKIINDLHLDKTQLSMILDDLKNESLIFSEIDSFECFFRVNADSMSHILDQSCKNDNILKWLHANQDCE